MTQPGNRTVASSRIQSGSAPAAGIMGNVVYTDTYIDKPDTVVVNNHAYAREDLTTTCARLDTHGPEDAYRLFCQEEPIDYRRLVLRTLPVQRAVQILTLMAKEDDGPSRCAEHLGPMDGQHAIGILRSLSPRVRAGALTRMHPEQAARILGAAKADSAQLLSEMTAVDPDAAKAILNLPAVRDQAAVWLTDTKPNLAAALLALMSPEDAGDRLDAMPPAGSAAVIAAGFPNRWLAAMSSARAARALTVLAHTDPAQAAACLGLLDHDVAADLLTQVRHDPDPRPQVVRKLPPSLAVALLARMHAREPETARKLLDAQPDWRRVAGTWPSISAAAIAARTNNTAGDARRSWWPIRRAIAAWTPDLRSRRARDVQVAAATALVTTLVAVTVTWTVCPDPPTRTAPPAPAATTAPLTLFSPTAPLMANRRVWNGDTCPRWSEQVDTVADRPVVLRLVCQLRQNRPATSVAFLQYPADSIPFKNRPTTKYPVPDGEAGATVHRILTPAKGEPPPTWAGNGHHGTYLEYLPDEGMSAIWLENQDDVPAATILFGPDPSGMNDAALRNLFASLREVLSQRGYTLNT